ncbi:alpha-L-fucosidase [Oleiagrimonas sp. C23AA]|uniref:alpha-L-fucosidase n=1 Tax=Oleiagrimonas sp. C23AA TaxID=2719047 RepID=UPI0014224B68|nr:alpha-L-fucosidase [Oleiagrimonas sp. C23AA]NII09549.1 alpha-L-fucosidase [Oleiagrimonas sp. C23AA]
MDRRQFTKLFAAAGLAGGALPASAWSRVLKAPSGARTGPWQAASPMLADSRLHAAQQAFLDLRFGMYIHLNMATFEEREWGDPKTSPKRFNPKHLDARQWARAARSAHMGYGCLTTKHHDGFCLWPTKSGSANVMDSSYPHDIVRQYVEAFRAEGLEPCLYFSILDLRADIRPHVITPAKVARIKTQITELLTHYGPITALVIDGWNASWSRIGYDELPFHEIRDLVKRLQPDCLISDYNDGSYPGTALYYTDVKQYEQHAGQKIPPHSEIPSQSATTLQKDWFWKKSYPTSTLRDAHQIVHDWLKPFNRQHCNLILNAAPNRDGLMDDNVLARLAEIGRLWQPSGTVPRVAPAFEITTPNLAKNQPSHASSLADASGPDLAFDDDLRSYWQADAGHAPHWLEVAFPKPTPINTLSVVEARGLGDYGHASRIRHYRIEAMIAGRWRPLFAGGTPQHFEFLRTGNAQVVERLRLHMETDGQPPGIAEFGAYNEPALR